MLNGTYMYSVVTIMACQITNAISDGIEISLMKRLMI